MNKTLLYIIITLLISIVSNSQEYSFKKYNIESGLSQSQIKSIVQDKYGFLWIATLDGLNRFDGINFETFYEDKINSSSISDIEIIDDVVYVITKDGLVSLSTNKNLEIDSITTHLEGVNYLSSQHIDNYIYLVNNDYELNRYDLKTQEIDTNFYFAFDSLDYIIRVVEKFENKLYIGTNKGLFRLNKDNEPIMILKSSISSLVKNQNVLWIGSYLDGIFCIENDTIKLKYSTDNILHSNIVKNIYFDNKNHLWAITGEEFYKIGKNQKLDFYNKKNSFDAIAEVIIQDYQNNIWVGTDGKGIWQLQSYDIESYTKLSDLPSDIAMAITQDKEENIWMGFYDAGAAKLMNNDITIYNTTNGNPKLLNNKIWTILSTDENDIWLGSSWGINIFESNGMHKTYNELNGLYRDKTNSLFQDKNGIIWIASSRSISKYENDKFTHYDTILGERIRNVRYITQNIDGTLLFGMNDHLYTLKGDKWSELKSDLFLNNTIYNVIPIKDRCWVGTKKGLILYENNHKSSKIKLANLNINAQINFLILQNDSSMMVGTNNGVLSFNPYLPDSLIPKNLIQHGIKQELLSSETNLNSAFKDKNNNIWFGTNRGVVKIKPRKDSDNDLLSLNTRITDVKLYFQSIDRDDNNIFKFNQNYFTFNYLAVAVNRPEEVKYQFRLLGVNNEWSPYSREKSITFSNLSYGKYTFQVRASYDGKNWGNIATYSFTIKTPYYYTAWFITLIFVGFVLITFLILRAIYLIRKRRREQQITKLQAELLRLEQQALNASMNRHFIFNSLNSIQFYINREDKLSANKYLSNFAKLIRRNLDSSLAINGLIPLNEELERLKLYLQLEHMRFEQKFDYQIDVMPEINIQTLMVPSMFLQPFIENSIWHGLLPLKSRKGKINLSIYANDEFFYFEIRDNGIGYDQSKLLRSKDEHQSMGMSLTTNRIKILDQMFDTQIQIVGPKEIKNNSDEVNGTLVTIKIHKEFTEIENK